MSRAAGGQEIIMVANGRYTALTTTVDGITYAFVKHLGSTVEWVEKIDELTGEANTDIRASFKDSVYWALACAASGTEWEGHYPAWWNDCAPEWLNEVGV